VKEDLERTQPPLNGQFLGIAGNLGALAAGFRFLNEDLNRIWSDERIARQRTGSSTYSSDTSSEAQEQRELIGIIDRVFQDAKGDIFFVDLHTTSASGGPFTIFGDTLSNRRFALNFPVPMILGLEEQIEGTLLEYVGNRGATTLGFEAGPHESPASVARQEAAIWIALTATGILNKRDCPLFSASRQRLQEASSGLPRAVEVRHRHAVSGDEAFLMDPGFENFDRVEKGHTLARNSNGRILAPLSGRILLPLYQSQGSDGFFLVKKIWPVWLRLSKLLRSLHLDSYIHLLPGVNEHPTQDRAFLVNSTVARWRTVEIFHLLGYRRCRPEGDSMVFTRR